MFVLNAAGYSERTANMSTCTCPFHNFLCCLYRMDLLGPYNAMKDGNQYVLTVICMLTNYVFMVLIKTKTTENVINAYLKHVYFTLGGSKYILNDRVGEFLRRQFTW